MYALCDICVTFKIQKIYDLHFQIILVSANYQNKHSRFIFASIRKSGSELKQSQILKQVAKMQTKYGFDFRVCLHRTKLAKQYPLHCYEKTNSLVFGKQKSAKS
ncbi:Hypothetical_protein [Hexamita inflata]|uniref:Hypothetical_protein n=1 Tax=Hexamita inflata TaxID=28002 RepID=A0AA86PMK2_9EUKA|nr:Hypothetical protein HINF_LOCUS30319 [Hexamita inflata]